MPVEHLWQWLREDVTYHTCYDSPQELIQQVSNFQKRINYLPFVISDCLRQCAERNRLWVKQHLEPEEEKLRFSK